MSTVEGFVVEDWTKWWLRNCGLLEQTMESHRRARLTGRLRSLEEKEMAGEYEVRGAHERAYIPLCAIRGLRCYEENVNDLLLVAEELEDLRR